MLRSIATKLGTHSGCCIPLVYHKVTFNVFLNFTNFYPLICGWVPNNVQSIIPFQVHTFWGLQKFILKWWFQNHINILSLDVLTL